MPPPPRSQFQFALNLTPVVKRLLIALPIVWLVTSILLNTVGSRTTADIIGEHLLLTPSDVIPGARVWQLLTYSWLHEFGALSHILFNCLALFFLGPELERRWGSRSFLKFYLLTALFAGVFTVLVGVLLPGLFGAPVLGASGAILGIVAAWSMVLPNTQLQFYFIIPIRAKYLIWIALGIDVLLFLARGPASNDTAIQTHIGGAIAAWFLITGNWHPRVFGPKLKRLFGGKPQGPKPYRIIEGGRGKSGRGDRDLLH